MRIRAFITTLLVSFLLPMAAFAQWGPGEHVNFATVGAPDTIQTPAAGQVAVRFSVVVVKRGSLGDPDFSELAIRLLQADGTAITDRWHDDAALAVDASNPSSIATNFPAASGWRLVPRTAQGLYLVFYEADTADTLEELTVELGYQDGSETRRHVVNIETVEGVAAMAADLTSLLADVGDASASTLGSLLGILGDPATTITADIATVDTVVDAIAVDVGDASTVLINAGDIATAIGDSAITVVAAQATAQASLTALEAEIPATDTWGVGASVDASAGQNVIATDTAAILVDTANIDTNTAVTVAGRRQVDTVNIDDAANGAVSVVAFTAAGGGEYLLESCIMRSNGTSADMTTLALYAIDAGGADPDNQVELIGVGTATKANLDEDGEQVAWTGAVSIDSGEVIFVLPLGTGVTPLDVDVTCTGYGLTDGQSLTPN